MSRVDKAFLAAVVALVMSVLLNGSGIDHTIPLTGYVAVALRRSPVGERFLLVGSHQGGESSVYTLSVHSEDPTLITTGTTAADWSPDGERIAVAERAIKSVLVLDGDEEPRSVAQFSTTPVGVRWSPDGELMAVVATGSVQQGYHDALYVVDLEGGGITPLVDGEAWVDWPEWSADGQRLLFTRGPLIRRAGLPYGDLWVCHVASGDLDQLTAGQGFDGLGTWSPQ
jgi:Tol biopolymer transport system component